MFERLAELESKSGRRPPTFLVTHPDSQSRVKVSGNIPSNHESEKLTGVLQKLREQIQDSSYAIKAANCADLQDNLQSFRNLQTRKVNALAPNQGEEVWT